MSSSDPWIISTPQRPYRLYESMLSVFANELREGGKSRVKENGVFNTWKSTQKRCNRTGGLCCCVSEHGVWFRDLKGVRSLTWSLGAIAPFETAVVCILESKSAKQKQLSFSNIADGLPRQDFLSSRFPRGCRGPR